MSSARNASAATSLPNCAALTPAGTGRSKLDISWELRPPDLALSRLAVDTFGPSVGRPAGGGPHPTGSGPLTQPGEHFQACVAVGWLHPDLLLESEDGFDGIAA